MPLYTVRRYVGPKTRNEVDAATCRAGLSAEEYPGLRWLRSYWHEAGQVMTCYYIAHSAEQIRRHSHQSNIPCDEIVEVTEIVPELIAEGAAKWDAAAAS